MRCSRCRVPRGARSSSFPSDRSRWTTCVSRSMETNRQRSRGAHVEGPRTDAVLNVLADVRVSRAQDVPPAQGEPWGWIVLGETGAEPLRVDIHQAPRGRTRCTGRCRRWHVPAARCRLCRPVGCADARWLTTGGSGPTGCWIPADWWDSRVECRPFRFRQQRPEATTPYRVGAWNQQCAGHRKADGRKCAREREAPVPRR